MMITVQQAIMPCWAHKNIVSNNISILNSIIRRSISSISTLQQHRYMDDEPILYTGKSEEFSVKITDEELVGVKVHNGDI